jgi:hypothetical protein
MELGARTGQPWVEAQMQRALLCTRTIPFVTAALAALALGCTDSTPPQIGYVRVTAITTGQDFDSDGYSVRIGATPAHNLGPNQAIILGGPAGEHEILLERIAPNCLVTGNPRGAVFIADDTIDVAFAVHCALITGSLRVRTITTGTDPDVDGYLVSLNDTAEVIVGMNATRTIGSMVPGSNTIRLLGVAPNCTVAGSNPRSVVVLPSVTTEITFEVSCQVMSAVRVTTVTSGPDPDPTGYIVAVSDGTREAVTVNGTTIIPRVAAGSRTIELQDVSVNCTVAGANPRPIELPAATTVDVTFTVTCTPAAQIAFTQFDNVGGAALYIVQTNGVGTSSLVGGANSQVDWTRDGTRIAFSSYRDGPNNTNIYTVQAGGGVPALLTTYAGADFDPSWSPDGSRIAFVSARGGSFGIYVMNADGSNVVRVSAPSVHEIDPAWSPDGNSIAFSRVIAGRGDIYVMNADGTNVRRLTNASESEGNPAWSPDGSMIAFDRQRACGYCGANIVTMRADGSEQNVIDSPASDQHPAWSRDGQFLAFVHLACDEYYSFYYGCVPASLSVMKRDGSGRTAILAGWYGYPAWKP